MHAPDLPGYGRAPRCAPYNLDGLSDALAQAAPPRCHVVGWSLGGQVALAWAKRVPRQVDRVALIAATPCFPRRRGWPHGVARDVLNGFSGAIAANPAGTLRRFFSLQAQGDGKARQVTRQLRAALAARDGPDPEALLGGLRVLLATDLREKLTSIALPVLVLHGDRDRLVPLGAGEYLGRNLPDARLVVLHGAAHAPFLSQPQAVAEALLGFFDE